MLTLKQINKQFKELGFTEQLERGEDYFYFVGEDTTNWVATAVYVYRLNELSLDGWVEELKFFKRNIK